MRDFWAVCEVSCDKLISRAFRAALKRPELGAVLGARSPGCMREQYRANRLGLRRAAEGDTATLDGALREWAEHDARRGIGVGCWHAVGRAVHRRLVPLLIRAYASEPERLSAALDASHAFLDRILEVIAEVHLEAARRADEVAEVRGELAECRARSEMLFDAHPLPAWVFDRETLRFLSVNDAAVRHYGYSRTEFLAMTIADMRPNEDVRALLGHVRTCLDGPVPGRWRHRKRDGSIISVEISGHDLALGGRRARLVVARDVTASREADELRRRSEARFRCLAESGVIGVVLTDITGEIRYVNSSMQRMLGCSSDELVDLRDRLAGGRDSAIFDETTISQITLDGVAAPRERELQRIDGSRIAVTVWGAAVDDGECIWFTLDASERQRAEHAIGELHQVQKVDVMGQLAGGIAHDFNNILTAVLSFSGLVLEALPEGPVRADVEEIENAGTRAASLTRQLLAVNRRQRNETTVLDLNEVVSGMEGMLQRILGEDIELAAIPDASIGGVRADRGQIEQVLLNLAVNGRQAMPMGGKLLITTGALTLDEGSAASCPALRPGPYVTLTVSDDGCGMEPETESRIFEPFFTTKAPGTGTGLGLSTVHEIVQRSGGGILVRSQPGRGTTFEVRLPAVDQPVLASPSAVERFSPAARAVILIVEDDDVVRDATRRVLAFGSHEVLSARNRAEAQEISAQHDGPIHLLLSDMVMPGTMGPEVAASLASSRPDMKVLFMSGYTDHVVVRKWLERPDIGFLAKPFTPDTLLRRIAEVLAGKLPE